MEGRRMGRIEPIQSIFSDPNKIRLVTKTEKYPNTFARRNKNIHNELHALKMQHINIPGHK
jgi:hypothetical protein